MSENTVPVTPEAPRSGDDPARCPFYVKPVHKEVSSAAFVNILDEVLEKEE